MKRFSTFTASSTCSETMSPVGVHSSALAWASSSLNLPPSSISSARRRSSRAAACGVRPQKPALAKKAASWKRSAQVSASAFWCDHQARSLRLRTLQKPSMALVCAPLAATNSFEWFTIEWFTAAVLRSRYMAAESVVTSAPGAARARRSASCCARLLFGTPATTPSAMRRLPSLSMAMVTPPTKVSTPPMRTRRPRWNLRCAWKVSSHCRFIQPFLIAPRHTRLALTMVATWPSSFMSSVLLAKRLTSSVFDRRRMPPTKKMTKWSSPHRLHPRVPFGRTVTECPQPGCLHTQRAEHGDRNG
mmetsp:Transcript_17599/g.54595  ORF Transcript_17599/g.54595 Transcript_17599/m.54595 type:complete len:303 (-) Transcript_17599:3540-4448(-)